MNRSFEVQLENAVLCVEWRVEEVEFGDMSTHQIEYSPELVSWSLVAYFDNMEQDVTAALPDKVQDFYEAKVEQLIAEKFAQEGP